MKTQPAGELLFFIPDVHVPYHDKKAWSLVLQIIQAIKPARVVIGGDFIDNYAISSHMKDISRKLDWQWEIDQANIELDKLQRMLESKTRVDFIEGNHEFRWPRYLASLDSKDNRRANSMQDILCIEERGWHWTPYKDFIKIGKLYVTHDTGKAGKYAVHQAMDDFQSNVVINHIHRIGIVYAGDARGKSHVAASFGWLGDKAMADYMFKIKANRDWHLGFGIGYLQPNGTVHLQAVPIVDYTAVVGERKYSL